MEGGANRGPAIAGVIAMVLGVVLILVSGGDGPARPQVLGRALVATTTTSSAAAAPSPGTASEETAAPRARRSAPERVTSTAPTSTTAQPSSTTTTSGAEVSTSAPTTTALAACPTGAPAAEVRSWEAASDESGTWFVSVTGVVSNRTGAPVAVDPLALTIVRIDGTTYDVPVEERPAPTPSEIADDGEGSWQWFGALPSGAQITGAEASLTTWRWTDAPAHCTV
jgi:hypothetical protein